MSRKVRLPKSHAARTDGSRQELYETDKTDRISMSTIRGPILTADSPRESGIKLNKISRQLYHPKKSRLKRRFEQSSDCHENVLVQPAQHIGHSTKRFKSDWDFLFYNDECSEELNEQTAVHICDEKSCSQKKKERQSFLVRGKEMKSFFHLLDDDLIQDFLCRDKCMSITDKYLLAMVFAYFKRAGYKVREYTRMNFFIALYLANDMEEDEEEMKYEIFPWALGDQWRDKYPRFLLKKDKLWCRIDHRAVVSKCCCEQIMAIEPDHPLWKRIRPDFHGGALRNYMKKDDDDGYPRGPKGSPKKCSECDRDSQYDSASPLSLTWYVSSGGTSPDTDDIFVKTASNRSSFDMKGLKKTLPKDKWPAVEE